MPNQASPTTSSSRATSVPISARRLADTFGWVFTQTDVGEMNQLNDHRRRTKALRAERPDFSTMSDEEIWDRNLAMVDFHRELFAEHLVATTLSTVPVGVIQGVATAVGRPDLILPLLSGFGQVDSAEPSYAMWNLSRLDPSSDEFAEGLQAFTYEYGSRGPNEWEVRSPTWETQPNLALAAIDRMRGAPASADPMIHQEARRAEREQAAATLLSMVSGIRLSKVNCLPR